MTKSANASYAVDVAAMERMTECHASILDVGEIIAKDTYCRDRRSSNLAIAVLVIGSVAIRLLCCVIRFGSAVTRGSQ